MRNETLEELIDPIDRQPFSFDGKSLVARSGKKWPVINGVPILLRDDVPATLHVAEKSIALSRSGLNDGYFVETLGISDPEKEQVRMEIAANVSGMDPVIKYLIPPAAGLGYRRNSASPLPPIPSFPLVGHGERLLDVGCNWGRWTMAAAMAGFRPIGVDPSLGALLAARRHSEKIGVAIDFVCADARYLPFRDNLFQQVYSYSVLQHFSREDVGLALSEIRRVLSPSGRSLIQMANQMGVRSMMHVVKRGFRKPSAFDVRYWTLSELNDIFEVKIGPTKISTDCFFGLGLQKSDIDHMTPLAVLATRASEIIKVADRQTGLLTRVADSVYCDSTKPLVD